MTTIALIHGAWHGAWCWDRLAPLLHERGYHTVAPDLPCDDPTAGIPTYADVVESALADAGAGPADDDVVLVGHSLGGLTVPVVASHRPVRRMVFLCSVPTGPGPALEGSMAEMVTPEFLAAARFHDTEGREVLDNAAARELFFHDCPDEEAWRAIALLRPQSPRPLTEPSPIEVWPEVPQSVILAEDDRAVRSSWSRAAARSRLGGAEPILLPGSHSPFLSRPEDLASALHRIITG